jgi:uncharacterized protein YyaL (SSP411 family)
MRIPASGGQRGIPARGIDYANLLDALFVLYRHDLEPSHLAWADALASEAITKLADPAGLLQEIPAASRLVDLPLYSPAMIFGGSTWGRIYAPLARLQALTGSPALAASVEAIANRLSPSFGEFPIQHTDFGVGVLSSLAKTIIVFDGSREDPILVELLAVGRKPAHARFTLIHLAPSLPSSFKLPQSGDSPRALLLRDGAQVGEARTAEELRALLASADPAE